MKRFGKSFIILLVIFSIQLLVYIVIIQPRILTWGATESEIRMSLAGDSLAPFISSTRAITINTSKQTVWKWITQLGADRAGWFSYTFLEKMMGYHTDKSDNFRPIEDNFEVGRIIPGTISKSKSMIDYNFPVVYVDSGNSFVLEKWGTFYIYEVASGNTRLVVRTNGFTSTNLFNRIGDFIITPLHYLMERRMMMGMKECAERDDVVHHSSVPEILWFTGIILSLCGIILMIFLERNVISFSLAIAYSITWLWILLIFNPHPLFSNLQLLTVLLTITWIIARKKRIS